MRNGIFRRKADDSWVFGDFVADQTAVRRC
jgi:hypothetical protein